MEQAKKFLPIAEQAADKSVEVPVGKTVKACREMGFELPDDLEDGCILAEDDVNVHKALEVDISLHGRRTGYVWLKPWTPQRYVKVGIVPGVTVGELRARGLSFANAPSDSARVVGYSPPFEDDIRQDWRVNFDDVNPYYVKLRELLAADAMVPDHAAALTPEHRHRMLTYLGRLGARQVDEYLDDLVTGYRQLCKRYAPQAPLAMDDPALINTDDAIVVVTHKNELH